MDILNDGKNQEIAQYISGMISNTLKNNGLSLLGITISANKLNSISDAAFRGVVPEATQKVSSNWPNSQSELIDRLFLTYWNGAYTNNGDSNLTYCNRGTFGTIVTKNIGDYLPITGGTITGRLDTNNIFVHSGCGLHLFSGGDGAYGVIYQSGAQQTGLRPSYNETSYGWIFGVRDSRWGITPITDVYSTLGSPSYRFATIYSSVASINTSDRNQKDNITYLDNDNKYMDLFYKLKPCTYKLKNTDPNVKHDRIHTGFIAQDVEESLQEVGLTNMDFAALCKDKKEDSNGDYIYSLRYSEFISLAVQAIQDLKKEVEDLKNQLERR